MQCSSYEHKQIDEEFGSKTKDPKEQIIYFLNDQISR
jgi:hypothetical protein